MLADKSFSGNSDLEQSISDEEEQPDCTWPENFVSLARSSDRKKESMGVASQLELLKGVHQNVGFSSDDEVEVPDFDDKRNHDSPSKAVGHSISLERDGSTHEVDEQLSSDEESEMIFKYAITKPTVSETLDLYARGKQKQFEPCTWSTVDKDARRPVDRYFTMGGRPTTKARLPSHYQQHKKGTVRPSVKKCEEHVSNSTDDDSLDEPEAINCQPMDKSISELVGCSDGKQISESNVASPVAADIQHDRSRFSVIELLDDRFQKSSNPYAECKESGRRKGRMGKHTVIRSASTSGKDTVSDEDPCEVMHSGLSTVNEEKAQNPELAVVEFGTRTMADKFHEAFGSSVNDRRPSFAVVNQSSNGLFSRLQKALQSQKERDTEFFRNLQTDVWPKGEASCLDVKILSRSYDAKLTVCQCSLFENEESSLKNPQLENFGKVWTVIFSSRVCGDVDLEAASLVRIHPPWKAAQVVGGEIVILATYYSQINTR